MATLEKPKQENHILNGFGPKCAPKPFTFAHVTPQQSQNASSLNFWDQGAAKHRTRYNEEDKAEFQIEQPITFSHTQHSMMIVEQQGEDKTILTEVQSTLNNELPPSARSPPQISIGEKGR